jgi:hypothetical protein
MEYGSLIRDAWRLTWRHRFLWLIGLFAGGAGSMPNGGGGPNWRIDGSDAETGRMGELGAAAGRAASQAAAWVAANAGLVVLVLTAVALVGLGLLALCLVAQGAMARATADLAEGRPTGPGPAWRAGLRLVWRYAGLWLTLIGASIVLAALVGALILAGGFLLYAVSPVAVVALAVLVGLPLLLAAIAAGVAVSIVVAFAQRAIAVEDLGPLGALGAGWRLLRAHLGESLLTWLIALGLGVGAGLATALALGVLFAVLGGVGVGVWAVAGLTGPTVVYGVGAGLALLAVLLAAIGVANTFFWNYWTIAYLRLSGHGAAV